MLIYQLISRIFYDHKISNAEISSITDKLLPLLIEWRSRTLEKVYPIVFLDGMYFKVKEGDRVINKCVYRVLGINQKEKKGILGFYSDQSEGAKFWMGILADLKERGLEDILIMALDGLKIYLRPFPYSPHTQAQLCVVHQIRNLLRYVSYKDTKVFLNDLKKPLNLSLLKRIF